MTGSSHDASFGRLAARRLAASAGPARVCPDAEVWAAYVDGGIGPDEQARLEAHLVSCAECRRLVAALSPVDAAVPVAAGGGAPAARVIPFRRALMTRWLPLAATLVAGTALWYVAAPRHAQPDGAVAQRSDTPGAPESRASAPAPAAPLPSREAVGATPAEPVEVDRLRAQARQTRAVTEELAQKTKPAEAGTRPTGIDAVRAGLAKEQTAAEEQQKLLARRADEYARLRREAAEASLERRADSGSPPVAAPSAPDAARQVASEAVAGAVADNAARPASPAATDAKAESARSRPLLAAAAAGLDAEGAGFASVVFGEPEGRLRWRIVDGRRIESSSDGGATWSPRFTESSARLSAGSAPAIETAWVVGTRGTVLRLTVPGGWTHVTRPTEAALVSVQGIDAQRARVIDASGRSYVTDDGGITWRPAGVP